MSTSLNSLQNILESIPDITPENVNLEQLEDMEKIHHSLTLDNPLTYFVFMSRRKDLTTEYRNTLFKIIQKLKNNNKTIYENGCARMEYVK